MIHVHDKSNCSVQYVDNSGHIANLQFWETGASEYTCVFVAYGEVWLYELDYHTDLVTHISKARGGDVVGNVIRATTFIDGDRVIVISWIRTAFFVVTEFTPDEFSSYKHYLVDSTIKCWYNGRIRSVVREMGFVTKPDEQIAIPDKFYYLGVRYRVCVLGINNNGIGLISLERTIIAGWCIKRNALIWAHDCATDPSSLCDATYATDSVVQYRLTSDRDNYTWHYYNVTDGTDYDVC